MSLLAYAAGVLLSSSLIAAGVLALSWTAFRQHPAARYFLCFGGLLLVLLTPVTVELARHSNLGIWTIPLPQFGTSASPVVVEFNSTPVQIGPSDSLPSIGPYELLRFAAIGGLPALWLAGTLFSLLRWMFGLRRVRRMARMARPLETADIADVLDRVQSRLNAPHFTAFSSGAIREPLTVGIFRPKVLLPNGMAEQLTPRELEHVLLHEGAHVALRHSLGLAVQRATYALFWMNPLVRLLGRELAWAREEVCDNVAAQEHGATCYARTLLAMAERIGRAPNFQEAMALLGPETCLENRIAGLLSPRRNRMIHVGKGKALLVTGLLSVVLASAAVRVSPEKAADVKPVEKPKKIDDKKPIVVEGHSLTTKKDEPITFVVSTDRKSFKRAHGKETFVYKVVATPTIKLKNKDGKAEMVYFVTGKGTGKANKGANVWYYVTAKGSKAIFKEGTAKVDLVFSEEEAPKKKD